MQLNQKLIQFYSINLINLLIALLLLMYENRAFYASLVFLAISGIAFIICPLLVARLRRKIKKNYFQHIILISVSVQVLYCCFLNENLLKLGYVLLKVQELQIIKKLTLFKALLTSICYNICCLSLLIYWNENPLQYIAMFYGSIIFVKKQEQKKEVELRSHCTKPTITKRDSEIVNLIQDSISNSWMLRLQYIPVGIMIVKKENLQVIFLNQSLLKIFNETENVSKFIMEELTFKLAIKRKRKQARETSIKPQKQSTQQQATSIPKFLSLNKIQSTSRLPATLKEILIEMQNGNLERYYSKENNIELLAQITKARGSFHEEDDSRSIQCKIFCSQNDQEYLIIIDDISLQSYLQKLETREKFQVRIIDSFSHELRTPLNSAKLFLDALANDDLITEKHRMNYIIPASNTLKLQAYLIRDIIDFTQFHSHIIKYNYEQFNFENIVEEINNIFKPMCQFKNLGLHIILKNQVPPVLNSDFDRIMQILVNVISNSIKFSEKGLIQVEISCQENILTFSIKDHGVGIDHQQLSKIQNFLKSFNTNRDFTSHDEWQGLGLLVSQMNLFKLAPLHRTQLKIHSNGPKEGTTVIFQLKTTQSTNTQIFGRQGTQIKRPSLKSSFTVPDFCFGIQGILIINNPKSDPFSDELGIQQIPIKHHSSVANYFRPQQETDLPEDTEKGNPIENLTKLQSYYKHFPLLQIGSEQKEKSVKRRKQSSFSVSEFESSSNNRPNTLISRLIQKEEEEIQMEERFENLRFSCRCARILSVDDDSFNQRALQVIIGQMGYRLILAYNGAQAIDVVFKTEKCSEQCQLFHFILMDCQMPVIDGWEATKTLVEMMRSKSIPEIPIIGLTAFNSTEDINKCLDVGMREVLTKPLNLNELKQVLLKLFN